MKTLYVRFVVIVTLIIVVSSLLAFVIANVYYQVNLKSYNDKKMMGIANETVALLESTPELQMNDYFHTVANIGYQLYVEDDSGSAVFYGNAFKNESLESGVVNAVLNGEEYHGIAQYPKKLFITGFFDNELQNTVGVPFQYEDKKYALFIRPDIVLQFGEMRIFFAQLLICSVAITILFIFIGTTYIVRPIRNLTAATKKIAEGEYSIQLDVERKDELGTLATSFTRMTESLKQIEEMRQEFISNVSHEIQSPLTSIQGFSQALRTENLSNEEREHYLSIIEEESRRLSVMSKQLLVLSYLDKEHNVIDIDTFNVSEQMKQVIRATEWYWREKELALELELSPVWIKGNKQFIYQVWMNLLYNSMKFTEAGGMISVSIWEDEQDMVHVVIEDTGQGITEEDLPYIFERYYKGDKSRKREGSGSGLGLSIVYKIVQLHKGSVMVQSAVGEGTRFEVILPS
ncbi:sensor histidine kinase [Priestia taiwanensis]|uniref:Heme sensor protein HssS n=1 Tax=Priestia taiwanensis TaxID=1347902 RepID=A0A917AVX7_9BACI|nr:HAMP domain-containing sensor histidine kinase [Priestia taiwanensis]MBM7364485.1 signal transduction histidine kinase [Priestia taiwanensis]GGE81104.1 two-component sensor histidine kinase [Priestia taiwanensis]